MHVGFAPPPKIASIDQIDRLIAIMPACGGSATWPGLADAAHCHKA
jgi:hypothetical protein